MDKQKIAEFFDACAPTWDSEMIRNDKIIGKILDGAGVKKGADILDVACGTGVLIPDYLYREVGSVTGVDISPEMLKIAESKFNQSNVSFLCADAETEDFGRSFDCVMIYNAFPHFPNPEIAIKKLSEAVRPGGTLTVAHGMSRAALEKHHSGRACEVSSSLMSEDELAALFPGNMEITVKISDDSMYQVTGRKQAV